MPTFPSSPSPSSPSLADVKKITIPHYLLLAQVVFMGILWAFWHQINKIFKEQDDQVKASSLNSVLNGVMAAPNPQNFCITSANAGDYKKLQSFTLIVSIFIVINSFINSIHLAFQYKFSTDRSITGSIYGLLAASGIVGMALSVDGFLKIRSLVLTNTNMPADCASLSNKLKIFFILSITINVLQAMVFMWMMKDLYYVARS
jgi:hypothetical protein